MSTISAYGDYGRAVNGIQEPDIRMQIRKGHGQTTYLVGFHMPMCENNRSQSSRCGNATKFENRSQAVVKLVSRTEQLLGQGLGVLAAPQLPVSVFTANKTASATVPFVFLVSTEEERSK